MAPPTPNTPRIEPAESPVTIPDFGRWKRQGRKITVLTAYDVTMARLDEVEALAKGGSARVQR